MHAEDLCIWPCGTACYAEDLEDYLRFMSDDYQRISVDSPEYTEHHARLM